MEVLLVTNPMPCSTLEYLKIANKGKYWNFEVHFFVSGCMFFLMLLFLLLLHLSNFSKISFNYFSTCLLVPFSTWVGSWFFFFAVIHEAEGQHHILNMNIPLSIPATVKKLFNLKSNFLTERCMGWYLWRVLLHSIYSSWWLSRFASTSLIVTSNFSSFFLPLTNFSAFFFC